LKDLLGFGSQWNFDESFEGFSWALGQGWVVLGSGSEIYFDEKQKKSIFQSLWTTRNQKLKINEKKWIGPGLAEKRSPN
jgi:hypothetical protein